MVSEELEFLSTPQTCIICRPPSLFPKQGAIIIIIVNTIVDICFFFPFFLSEECMHTKANQGLSIFYYFLPHPVFAFFLLLAEQARRAGRERHRVRNSCQHNKRIGYTGDLGFFKLSFLFRCSSSGNANGIGWMGKDRTN